MAKSVHNDVLDAALNYIKDNCTRIVACSAEPTTYTEGNATYALADITVDGTDFTLADGDTSGRKATVSAQNGVAVDVSGTVTHLAYLDVTNTKLLFVNTTTSQGVSSGGTVDIGAHKIEIGDPT